MEARAIAVAGEEVSTEQVGAAPVTSPVIQSPVEKAAQAIAAQVDNRPTPGRGFDGGGSTHDGSLPSTQSDAEEFAPLTISDLAEVLDVAPADVYNLAVPVTLNGDSAVHTLGELKDSFQKHQAADQKLRDAEKLHSNAKALFRQLNDEQVKHERSYQEQQALLDVHRELVAKKWQAIDFAALELALGAQAAAEIKQAALEEIRFIQDGKSALQASYERLRSEWLASTEVMRAQQSLTEMKKVYEVLEVTSEASAKAKGEEIKEYLLSAGFNESELAQMPMDARFIRVMYDASRYNSTLGKRGQEILQSKLKKPSLNGKKLGKPGARQEKRQHADDARAAARRRLKRSGKIDDAAELIRDRI